MFLLVLKVSYLKNPYIETYSLKAWVFCNTGDTGVICFIGLSHNVGDFFTANALGTCGHKIAMTTFTPVASSVQIAKLFPIIIILLTKTNL